MKRISAVAAAGLLAVLAGCSEGGTPNEPTATQLNPQVEADLVAIAADGVGEEVEIMRAPGFDLRMGFFGAPGAPEFGPCNLAQSTCTLTRDGMTVTRTLTYYDAAGKEMAAYDATQTASVKIVSQVKGSVTRETEKGSWSAEIDRSRTMTVSGLQGDEQKRTWNGTGAFIVKRTVVREQTSRNYEITGALKVTGVEVPRRNNESKDPWPLAGTIERTMTVSTTDKDGKPVSFTRKVVVTFNGTQFASATITRRDGSTESFQIDLATRKAGRKP
jgi:hypothetical protein